MLFMHLMDIIVSVRWGAIHILISPSERFKANTPKRHGILGNCKRIDDVYH